MQTARTRILAELLVAGAATVLVVTACSDQLTLLEPTDESAASRGPVAGTVDVIVVLKPEAAPGSQAANRSRAAQVAEDLGIEPRFTYGSVLFGFAGSVPEGRLNTLRRHPLVEYVDDDAAVAIPPTVEHHRPGHGGGNAPEPDPDPESQVTPWGVH